MPSGPSLTRPPSLMFGLSRAVHLPPPPPFSLSMVSEYHASYVALMARPFECVSRHQRDPSSHSLCVVLCAPALRSCRKIFFPPVFFPLRCHFSSRIFCPATTDDWSFAYGFAPGTRPVVASSALPSSFLFSRPFSLRFV